MTESKRIMILGASGMLGHKLWQQLSLRFPDVWGTLRRSRASIEKFGAFYQSDKIVCGVQVDDFENVRRVLDAVKPNVVLNCIGITKRKKDLTEPLQSISLNARLPHLLNGWAHKNKARLLQFSTDCVFDGLQGGYSESSVCNASDLYGRTKTLGEVQSENSITIRTSYVGPELEGGTELFEWFLSQKNKKIKGYKSALYSGMSTIQGAKLVGDIIEKYSDLTGIWQVASQPISKFDLLHLFNQAFHTQVEIEPDAAFICARNLNGSKFFNKTGFTLPSWSEMVSEMSHDKTPYNQWR